MPKESGLGQTTLSVDDSAGSPQDIRTDVLSWDLATPRGVQDVTGVDKSAVERLLLLADASVTFNGVFDDGANLAHVVFKTVPSTSVNRTVAFGISGQTLSMEMVFSDFSYTRAASGELTWTAPGALATGVAPTWS